MLESRSEDALVLLVKLVKSTVEPVESVETVEIVETEETVLIEDLKKYELAKHRKNCECCPVSLLIAR